MDKTKFEKVAVKAAAERSCEVLKLDFNGDDNVFDLTLVRLDGEDVTLDDCEYVHRALLTAFDRDKEDYALTVGSAGLSPEQADALLETIKEQVI